MDETTRRYVLYDSPLKTKNGQITLALLILMWIPMVVMGYRSFYSQGVLFQTLLWVPYSIIGSIIAYLIIAFVDRKRRIRIFHFIAIFSVTFYFASAAAFFNDISPAPLVTVGFNEEFFKILPVLLFAIFIPNLIRTKKDGIVYGALAGIGFNIIEIGLYISNAMKEYTMLEALYLHTTRLALWGFGSHVIWSAFVGLGIGIAMQSNKKGFKKWIWPFATYFIVAISHSAFDIGLSGLGIIVTLYILSLLRGFNIDMIDSMNVTEQDLTKPGILRDSLQYEHFVYNIVFIVILIWQLIKSIRWEQRITIEQLSDEASVVMSEEEKTLLNEERFLLMRKYEEYPRKVSNKIVKYQNLLAMLKHSVSVQGKSFDDVEEIKMLRQEIIELKQT